MSICKSQKIEKIFLDNQKRKSYIIYRRNEQEEYKC
nr:MAG TPA: hypothetical protein [Caudoviricetes sp.]